MPGYELLRELVGAEVLVPAQLVEFARGGELRAEPLDQLVDVGLEDAGVVRAPVQVGEVDLPSLGQLGRGGERGFPGHRSLGRTFPVRAELPMLLGGRPLDLGDVLQQEATPSAPLESDGEDRPLEAVADHASLLQDLDLLRMGPDEVEDLVVGGLGVFQERCEGRDRLAAPGRGVDEEGSPATGSLGHGGDQRLLSRRAGTGRGASPRPWMQWST